MTGRYTDCWWLLQAPQSYGQPALTSFPACAGAFSTAPNASVRWYHAASDASITCCGPWRGQRLRISTLPSLSTISAGIPCLHAMHRLVVRLNSMAPPLEPDGQQPPDTPQCDC